MPPEIRKHPTRDPASDYQAKTAHEASRIARRLKKAGLPEPLGDPNSGILLVVEGPAGPRLLEALRRSLEFVDLSDAYITWSSTGLLPQQILATEPAALISIGPQAAREIDDLRYPLARHSFADATEGVWFSWKRGTAGLTLPALVPALHDEEAKRRFWQAFLTLRALTPETTP